jgi:hypothetical protein
MLMLPGLAGSILPPEGFYGQRGTAAERIAQNSRFAPGEAMWPVAPRGHQERRSPSRDSRAHQPILVNCFSSLWIVALAVGFAPALTASQAKIVRRWPRTCTTRAAWRLGRTGRSMWRRQRVAAMASVLWVHIRFRDALRRAARSCVSICGSGSKNGLRRPSGLAAHSGRGAARYGPCALQRPGDEAGERVQRQASLALPGRRVPGTTRTFRRLSPGSPVKISHTHRLETSVTSCTW